MSRDSSERLNRYLAGDLTASEMEDFARSAVVDPGVRNHVDDVFSTLVDSPPGGDQDQLVVTHEMLERYVDGASSDVEREIVESCMEIDDAVHSHVKDLFGLRTEVQGASAADFVSAADRPKQKSFFASFRTFAILGAVASCVAGVVAVLKLSESNQATNPVAVGNKPEPSILKLPPPTKPKGPVEVVKQPDESPKTNVDPKTSIKHPVRKPRPAPRAKTRPTVRPVTPATGSEVTEDVGLEPLPDTLVAMLSPNDVVRSSGDLAVKGSDSRARLLAPAGTFVAESRPNFAWTPIEGAATYDIEVFDSEGATAASSKGLTDPQWRPSESLPRSNRLQWTVTAKDDAGVELGILNATSDKIAIFEIGSVESAQQVTGLRQKATSDPVGVSRKLIRMGYLQDAEAILRAASLKGSPHEVKATRLLNELTKAVQKELNP